VGKAYRRWRINHTASSLLIYTVGDYNVLLRWIVLASIIASQRQVPRALIKSINMLLGRGHTKTIDVIDADNFYHFYDDEYPFYVQL
jgi:hypothetical protein